METTFSQRRKGAEGRRISHGGTKAQRREEEFSDFNLAKARRLRGRKDELILYFYLCDLGVFVSLREIFMDTTFSA